MILSVTNADIGYEFNRIDIFNMKYISNLQGVCSFKVFGI